MRNRLLVIHNLGTRKMTLRLWSHFNIIHVNLLIGKCYFYGFLQNYISSKFFHCLGYERRKAFYCREQFYDHISFVDTLPMWVDNFNDTQFEYRDLSQTLGRLKHQLQCNEVWHAFRLNVWKPSLLTHIMYIFFP
jgi:hypothetical protein